MKMQASRKLLLFLHKLTARHLSEGGAVSRGLLALSEGRETDLSYGYFPDNKMKFAAHVLCTLGQESSEDMAIMLTRACSAAIELADDKDSELQLQLVEALESLCAPDPVVESAPVTPPAPITPTIPEVDAAALGEQFKKSAVVITKHGGKELYTFSGHAAYPAELETNGNKFRLINGSYRKATYQKV